MRKAARADRDVTGDGSGVAGERCADGAEDALLELHGATTGGRLWRAMVKVMERTVVHRGLVAALPCEGVAAAVLRTTVPHENGVAFRQRVDAAGSPLLAIAARHPGLKLADLDERMAEAELMESRYWQDVMEPGGWRHSVGLLFWEKKDLCWHIEICRTAGQGRFTAAEKAKLLGLYRHFAVAIRRVALIARQDLAASLMREALEHPADGLVLLDARGRMVFQNHAAAVACAVWQRGRAASAERLKAESEALPECLALAAADLLAGFLGAFRKTPIKGRRFEMEVIHPQGEPVSASIRVVASRSRPVPPHVRIGFTRWSGATNGKGRTMPVHRLSEGEQRVALLVATGLSNAEVAEVLKLSIHTVRAHLREVFAKLEVHHRSQLAGQLAADREVAARPAE